MFNREKTEEKPKAIRDSVVLINPDLHRVLGVIGYLGKRTIKDVVTEAITEYYDLNADKIKQLLAMNNQFRKEK